MAARKPTAKRQPKSKSAAADAQSDAERETTPNHPANTTTVDRSRSADGINR